MRALIARCLIITLLAVDSIILAFLHGDVVAREYAVVEDGVLPITASAFTAAEPWIIMFNANGYTCSGSVLSEHWILTAAHCVDALPKSIPHIIVWYAPAEEEKEEIYSGPATFYVHPHYGPGLIPNWDPPDDIALIHLNNASGIPPPGIDLSLTGKAKLYVPFSMPLWAQSDANRLFSIIGWGDTGSDGDCLPGTFGKKRLGTYFEVDVADNNAKRVTAETGATRICNADSGAPWLFAHNGVHIAFAVTVGDIPNLVITGGDQHAAVIKAKMGWIYQETSTFVSTQFLNCAIAGYAGDLPYMECEEKKKAAPEPPPFPCPEGQHCCEPGAGNTCNLCISFNQECP